MLAGNDSVSVPEFRGLVPRELRRLRVAFNTMLDDLRRRNADTAAALRQAETSSVAKSQFLANMSHEIRTPLHGVMGMIELLQQTELSPTQTHYVRGARQSGETLLTLIDDVLDLSKIEAGKVELEDAPFHLPSLVHDLLLMFADQAKSKGLTLTASVPDELNLMVRGDAHRLRRISHQPGSQRAEVHGGGRRDHPPELCGTRTPSQSFCAAKWRIPESAFRMPSSRPSSKRSRRPTARPRGAMAAPASACRSRASSAT